MKRILIATDFSPASVNAHQYGLQLAHEMGAKVLVLHVYNPGQRKKTPLGAEFQQALATQNEEEALSFFKAYGEKMIWDLEIQVQAKYQLSAGVAVSEILTYATYTNPKLLVLGIHAEKGLDRTIESWFGNKITRILSKIACPILIVPEKARYRTVQHLVFATNFSEQEQRVPEELTMFQYAKISCVHVRNPKTSYATFYFRYLQEFSQLEMNHFNVGFYSIQDEHIWRGLDKFMAEKEANLLVMMKHRKIKLLSRFFEQKLTNRMTFLAKKPLLILNEEKLAAERPKEKLKHFIRLPWQ